MILENRQIGKKTIICISIQFKKYKIKGDDDDEEAKKRIQQQQQMDC